METTIYIKAFLVLILVISLVIVTVLLLRLLKEKGKLFKVSGDKKLKLEEILYLDNKRRLVFVSLYDKKYLILLGQQDILLDVIKKE